MTDTTDIKALREAATLIAHGYKQRWGCETNEDTGFVGVGTFDPDGDLCPFIEVSVSNWSDDDGDDERLAEFLTLANPVAILAILDQLEAERQRADSLSELYHATEKAVFKIAKTIKGDAFDKYSHSTSQAIDVIGAEMEVLREEKAKWVGYATQASNEVDKLKAKLANPVVLPERWKPCDCIDCAYAYDSDATKKAINEAGFKVKGYSPEQSVFQGVRP